MSNPANNDFQNCMGDFYQQWENYLKANTPVPLNENTLKDCFMKWANINAPMKAQCIYALTLTSEDPSS